MTASLGAGHLESPVKTELDPKASHWTAIWCWGWLILGAILRLGRFVHRRSLWLDELYLAKSITTRGIHDLLFRPLEAQQIAPPGFLVMTRWFVDILGPTERALRLTSFIFSLASLPLFYAVARRCLSRRGQLIAIPLFATLGPLIYYGNEVKQYSCDVVVCVAVALTLLRLLEKVDVPRLLAAALVGAVGVFFSQPAVFVLAGSGAVVLFHLWRTDRRDAARFAAVCAIWMAAFSVQFFLFIWPLMHGEAHSNLVNYWRAENGFMPLNPFWGVYWIMNRLWTMCEESGAMWLVFPDAGFLAILIGIASALIFRRRPMLILLAPLPVVFLASLLEQYPFGDRLTLFIVPAILLVISYAIDLLWDRSAGRIAAAAILLTILVPSAWRAMGYLFSPPGREESLPAYQWIARQWRPGDTVFLSVFAKESFDYYEPQVGWPDDPARAGKVIHQTDCSTDTRLFAVQPRLFAGKKRVWVVLIHIDGGDNTAAPYTLAGFEEIGRRISIAPPDVPGVRIYCYDCSSGPAPPPGG